MESIQIYLNSSMADKYYDSISDCEYLLPPIEIPNGFHIYLSVQNASIPFSFYNFNSLTNTLSYILNGITTNIIITEGNYNITQLITYLSSVTPFTITYNSITNKFNFTHTTYNFTFKSTSLCLSMLGFIPLIDVSSTALSLTSTNCINIQNIKRINISSNLITYNISKGLLNNYSILASIPINKPAFTIIEYSNTNHFRTNLFINNITSIKIKLIDEYGRLINLNGQNYCLTLQLDVEPFT
jgi:hypothetical protein